MKAYKNQYEHNKKNSNDEILFCFYKTFLITLQYYCLMYRLSRLKDGWKIIMSLVLSFITLITIYTYVPYQTYIKTHLVSTARSLTSVGQTAVQRILIVCPMETSLTWWYWSPLDVTWCMRGSSCSSTLNWLPCVEEDLIVFIFIDDVVYKQSHAALYSNSIFQCYLISCN